MYLIKGTMEKCKVDGASSYYWGLPLYYIEDFRKSVLREIVGMALMHTCQHTTSTAYK